MKNIRRTQVLAGCWCAVLVLLLTTPPADAHTGLESSAPAEGDAIDEPVDQIRLSFSSEVSPAGAGFVIRDPLGRVREPDEVTSTDGRTWILQFDEPLSGGDVGVRWTVAAPDAHPIDGSFRFAVTAAAPTPSTSATTFPTTTAETTGPTSANPTVAPDDPVADLSVDSLANAAEGQEGPDHLEEFLDAERADPGAASTLANLARMARVVAAMLAVGGAIFVAFALQGRADDAQGVLPVIRVGGALAAAGSAVEAVAQAATLGGTWSAAASPVSLANQLAGTTAVALALGFAGGMTIAVAARKPRLSVPLAAGATLVALSFAFDGHTASVGPRWLHALINVVHVVAATTWAGGVSLLAYTIWWRRRHKLEPGSLQLAARFSVIATAALLPAAIAGVALSAIVLDSASEIWSTPWGRILVAKIALAVIAMLCGAYNHRVMVPALQQASGQQASDQQASGQRAAANRFRAIVTAEAAILIAVGLVTGLLVGAPST